MPTYEYKCPKCKRTFEVIQKMSDPPLLTCDVCKGKVKRLIGSGAGIIFKGSGFYCTDYRNNSYKSGAARDKSDSSATAAKTSGTAEKKSDAAPAPTPTPKPV